MGIFDNFIGVESTSYDEPKGDSQLMKYAHSLIQKLKQRISIGAVEKAEKDLHDDIQKLLEHFTYFEIKMVAVNRFLKSEQLHDIAHITYEIERIKEISKKEYDDDKQEEKYVIKALKSIEKSLDAKVTEGGEDIRKDLLKLSEEVHNLQPVLERQIKFMQLPVSEQAKRVKDLLFDIHEEAVIIGAEKTLLKNLKNKIEKLEVQQVIDD
jgi:hypothetical protein